MCIRDRIKTKNDRKPINDKGANVRKTETEGAAMKPATPSSLRSRTATEEGNTCLLYTSDAADERSSVDLGGRRIIKKKKTVEHRAGQYTTNKY